jgi:hypothetical protein
MNEVSSLSLVAPGAEEGQAWKRLALSEWSRYTRACIRRRNMELCGQLELVWERVAAQRISTPGFRGTADPFFDEPSVAGEQVQDRLFELQQQIAEMKTSIKSAAVIEEMSAAEVSVIEMASHDAIQASQEEFSRAQREIDSLSGKLRAMEADTTSAEKIKETDILFGQFGEQVKQLEQQLQMSRAESQDANEQIVALQAEKLAWSGKVEEMQNRVADRDECDSDRRSAGECAAAAGGGSRGAAPPLRTWSAAARVRHMAAVCRVQVRPPLDGGPSPPAALQCP